MCWERAVSMTLIKSDGVVQQGRMIMRGRSRGASLRWSRFVEG